MTGGVWVVSGGCLEVVWGRLGGVWGVSGGFWWCLGGVGWCLDGVKDTFSNLGTLCPPPLDIQESWTPGLIGLTLLNIIEPFDKTCVNCPHQEKIPIVLKQGKSVYLASCLLCPPLKTEKSAKRFSQLVLSE